MLFIPFVLADEKLNYVMWKWVAQLVHGFKRVPETDSGLWGEDAAVSYLVNEGYRIVGRRVKVGSRDELDIVAGEGDVLVFVEVKTRKNEDFGRPLRFVDRRKRMLVSRAAVRYLKKLRCPRVKFRFDVVEVVGEPGDSVSRLKLIRNAFPLDRRYRLPW